MGVHELTIVSFDWVAGEAKITFHSQLSLDQVQEPGRKRFEDAFGRSLDTPVGRGANSNLSFSKVPGSSIRRLNRF